MISLRSYEFLADAWHSGVADWCRAASRHVLTGGRAWMVTVSDGQANWVKRRLLEAGLSLFGIQFLNVGSLRRELCLRHSLHLSHLGDDTLRFLLRLHALEESQTHPETTNVARHPGACLAALTDLDAAGWLEDGREIRQTIFPAALDHWLAETRRMDQWTPEIDRNLLERGTEASPGPPLALCVFGWDAMFWPSFRLLTAALREAQSSLLYAPLPRGSSENIQVEWLSALESFCGEAFEPCESVGFAPSHAAMIGRLEGTDLPTGSADRHEPTLLVGLHLADTSIIARDFVARWLAATPPHGPADEQTGEDRLVILSPRRDLAAVAVLRALAAAGIDVEDELGETPEPSLAVQIQRAILDYYQDRAALERLTVLVELLNEHVALWDGKGGSILRRVFPLDPLEVRGLLHSAFGEVQHHSARVLRHALARSRAVVGEPLCHLVDHLGDWPEAVSWTDALERWGRCLEGLGLSTDSLEPLWSQLEGLSPQVPVPATAFFQFLSGVLGCAPARRSPEGMHRYARVVLTTLDGAMGQSWGAALFLDSNEGAWPLYPDQDSFLDDAARSHLNGRREEEKDRPGIPWRGHLLTSSDRAQLEHFRFMEILSNCTGPMAFAGQARDATEPGKELYANEWALRCLLEAGKPLAEDEKLLDRWHGAIRRTKPVRPALPKPEREHLRAVFAGRRDPEAGFDEYGFNFESLTGADELPWTEAWSARDLETAWNQPATFALKQVFGAVPAQTQSRELLRGEGWMVGRLVHRWLQLALGPADEPRRMTAPDWQHALSEGLPLARHETERTLLTALTKTAAAGSMSQSLPLWWRGTLQKSAWAARRCLEGLAEVAGGMDDGTGGVWLSQGRRFHADIATANGALRVQARCDVVLSDRSSLADASCQLIDFRTGAVPVAGTHPAGPLEKGQGLNLAALMFLACKEGTLPDQTRVGIVHPEAANPSWLTMQSSGAAEPAMERLASQQHSLNFGQGGHPGSSGWPREGETLPLATVAIDLAVLVGKRRCQASPGTPEIV